MAQFLDLDGVRTLWAKIKAATGVGASTVSIDTNAAGAFAGFTLRTIVHDGQGEDGHIEYKLSLTDVQSASALQTLIADYALDADLDAAVARLTVLIGNDANKSVRTIANEELASQLIPASAQDALDTLQEIAAWIQNHPNEASAMNLAIQSLQSKTALPADGEAPAEGTIAKYAKDLVDQERGRASGEEARIEKILTEVEDPEVVGSKDGVLKRLDTLETAVGTPSGGDDISTQVQAVKEAIEDLDWTAEAGTGKLLTGFEVVNGKLKSGSITTEDIPTAITQTELNNVLV